MKNVAKTVEEKQFPAIIENREQRLMTFNYSCL
jgi:hypothetical protein